MLAAEIASYGYSAARSDFIRLARADGLELHTFVHPQMQGPGGEPLAIDVAISRPERMDALIVILSGTHGVEGLAGSLCQRALLRSGAQPTGRSRTGVLLIHALNPYGFAYLSRTNENNVDLNRNCLDSFHDAPYNASYGQLHPTLMPKEWDLQGMRHDAALSGAVAALGVERFQSVVTAGQYHWPTGLFYGGTSPQWSRRVLESIIAREFHGLDRVVVVDVHTGLGRYGAGELIYTGFARDPEYGATKAFFVGDTVTCGDTGDSVSAQVTGALNHLFRRWAEPGALASVALEFGVHDVMTTLDALRADVRLRSFVRPSAELILKVREAQLHAFFSTDAAWIERIELRFLDVIRAARRALDSRV